MLVHLSSRPFHFAPCTLPFAPCTLHLALCTNLRGGSKPGSVHPPPSFGKPRTWVDWAVIYLALRFGRFERPSLRVKRHFSGIGRAVLIQPFRGCPRRLCSRLPCTGRVCPPVNFTATDVRSYRTVSPLPEVTTEISVCPAAPSFA